MKAKEMEIIRDAVFNALDMVRALESEMKKGGVISKKDLKTFLGGNVEGKLAEALNILETEASTEG